MVSNGSHQRAASCRLAKFLEGKKRRKKKQKLRSRIELRNSNFSGVFLRIGKYSLLIERGSAGS